MVKGKLCKNKEVFTWMNGIRWCVVLLFALGINACIDKISEDVEEPEFIVVVDGIFSDRIGRQEIKLSSVIRRNDQTFKPIAGAMVEVEDESGRKFAFSESVPGVYTTEGGAESGKKYRMIASLSDGTQITSGFQEVPVSLPLDTLIYQDALVSLLDENGQTRRRWVLDIFARSSLPSSDFPIYLRYDLESVWQLSEVVCFPLITPKLCYIYDTDIAFDISLLEIQPSNSKIDFEQKVYSRFIDEAFGEVLAIKVDVLSYNEEQFRYWANIKAVFDQTGNITDRLPARISGGLTSNNEAEILGNFSVVGQSEKVIFLRNPDVERNVKPVCGIPGFQPRPLPDECCQCLSREGASLEKPYYWPF